MYLFLKVINARSGPFGLLRKQMLLGSYTNYRKPRNGESNKTCRGRSDLPLRPKARCLFRRKVTMAAESQSPSSVRKGEQPNPINKKCSIMYFDHSLSH